MAGTRLLRGLLRGGAETITVAVPAGERLILTWTAISAGHPHARVLLAASALAAGSTRTRQLKIKPRHGAGAAAARLHRLEVTVGATLVAPGRAPFTLTRTVRVG
jgi:hypothetical protein